MRVERNNNTARWFISTLTLFAVISTTSLLGEGILPTFVLAGQSNMVGKRCKKSALPPALQQPNPNALFFDAASGTWIPVEPARTEPKGFGPEIAFASAMSSHMAQTIGIIKLSRGGTNLHHQWNPERKQSLYQDLVKMVQTAGKSRPIKVIGMLWVQGGADSKSESMANAYGTNLERLITRARADFGNPAMAFLSGRIPAKNSRVKPFWKTVRHAQEHLKMEHYAWVDCDTISTGPDGIHYDEAGMVALGEVQAKLLSKILGRQQK